MKKKLTIFPKKNSVKMEEKKIPIEEIRKKTPTNTPRRIKKTRWHGLDIDYDTLTAYFKVQKK